MIFRFDVDDVKVCHLGDLGHVLSQETLDALGEIDVVLIPVGGGFTIDSTGANEVIKQMAPKVVMPMHYKTEKCGFPIGTLDDFLAGKTGIKRLDTSDVSLSSGSLPSATTIMVLKPAL